VVPAAVASEISSARSRESLKALQALRAAEKPEQQVARSKPVRLKGSKVKTPLNN
jgi:hypothetical protein